MPSRRSCFHSCVANSDKTDGPTSSRSSRPCRIGHCSRVPFPPGEKASWAGVEIIIGVSLSCSPSCMFAPSSWLTSGGRSPLLSALTYGFYRLLPRVSPLQDVLLRASVAHQEVSRLSSVTWLTPYRFQVFRSCLEVGHVTLREHISSRRPRPKSTSAVRDTRATCPIPRSRLPCHPTSIAHRSTLISYSPPTRDIVSRGGQPWGMRSSTTRN